MADPSTVVSGLVSYFETEFGTAEPTVQILLDNDPPLGTKTGTTKPDLRTGEWVRVSVQMGAGNLSEVGCDSSQQLGSVSVLIFTPLGSGTDRSWAIVDVVRNVFQGQKVSGAFCRQAEGAGFGASPDNIWFQNNVRIPFRFENTPA